MPSTIRSPSPPVLARRYHRCLYDRCMVLKISFAPNPVWKQQGTGGGHSLRQTGHDGRG
jgi:hypothetical protein